MKSKLGFKPRILWVSNDPVLAQSFAQQSQAICTELVRRGYDVHYLTAEYFGKPYVLNGFKVYPNPILSTNSVFCNESGFREYIKRIKPDLMISFNNTYRLAFLVDDSDFTKLIPWIHWTTHESEFPLYQILSYEQKIPYFLSIARFAYTLYKKLGYRNLAGCINPAVNNKQFYLLQLKEKLQLRKKYKIPKNAFVIGCVATCSRRKQIQRLVEAFEEFSLNKKNVYLVIYSNFEKYKQSVNFCDIRGLINNFYKELKDKIILIESGYDKPKSSKELNKIYNLFDVFALATAGEGWGIPIVEAMFCKVPPIVTDCTSIPEIIADGCGWKVKVKEQVWGLMETVEAPGALVDIGDMVKKLNDAYKNKKKRLAFGEKACQRAITLYSIDTIVDQWEGLIENVFLESKQKYKHLWKEGLPSSANQADSLLDITKWLCYAYVKQQDWGRLITLTEGEKELSLLNVRGIAFDKLGDFVKAKECFARILQIDSDNQKVKLSYEDVCRKIEQ